MPSELTITTNNVPRDLLTFYDLTEKERSDFDYVTEDDQFSLRFFRYRGNAYDSSEFVRIVPRSRQVGWEHGADEDSPLLAWDGIQTDSFFSAIVIRFAPDTDYERVIVGLALS